MHGHVVKICCEFKGAHEGFRYEDRNEEDCMTLNFFRCCNC